jgi:hypothetical protein
MYYTCSPRAEYYAYSDLFPTRNATRFSRLQHKTDETLATMFLRRIQPRPQIISAPPLRTPHWLSWCIDQVHQSGINPAYYTDGSYAKSQRYIPSFGQKHSLGKPQQASSSKTPQCDGPRNQSSSYVSPTALMSAANLSTLWNSWPSPHPCG